MHVSIKIELVVCLLQTFKSVLAGTRAIDAVITPGRLPSEKLELESCH